MGHHPADEVNMDRLCETLQESLTTYFRTAVDEKNAPRITGLYVVGSSLTDSFTPGESDIDVYICTDSECNEEQGIRLFLRDSFYAGQVEQIVGEKFTFFDLLDIGPKSEIDRYIRSDEPTQYFSYTY